MDTLNTEAPEAADAPLPALVFGRSSKKRKAYRQRGTEPTTTTTTTTTASEEIAASAKADAPAVETQEGPSKRDKDEGDAAAGSRQPDSTAAGDDDGSKDKETDNNGHDRWKENEAKDKNEKKPSNGEDSDDEGVSVAELLRRRKARKPVSGVTFRDEDGETSAAASSSSLNSRLDRALDSMELDLASDPMPMGVQFVKQTGMIGQLVNKHMEEYVEAQLAKRQRAEAAQALDGGGGSGGLAAASSGGVGGAASSAGGLSGTAPTTAEAREQLAMKGKLHEIDLGAEARARNIAMTERATQQLRGTGGADHNSSVADDNAAGRSNGKSLAQKHRRNSDDLKRDQLVEQFLHENRMDVDVYGGGAAAASSFSSLTTATEGRPTDDRIAEQFRREFMEAAAQRMRRKRKPLGPPTKPKARNDDEILRGPKLGGSRNVRSVMRDKLLQKQEEARNSMPKYELQLQEQKRRLNRRR